ncbi:MAG: thiol reductase thioredoxin [Frankiales bacterium]|nr:thiol reductase thioredoxin [Frankiales bacterium]
MVLVVSTLLGVLHRRREGKVRQVDERDRRQVLALLGEAPGERATLLQFSSAFCAPCRATRRVLGDIAAQTEGVRHVEVDAESHLELVRELGILKTPTTLVLDGRGHEALRAVGQPTTAAVLQALPS